MSNKYSNSILFLGIAVAIGIFIGSLLDYQSNPVALFSNNKQENKIRRLINYIEYDYVDEVDTDSLLDGAINQMLRKLDPHSVYIPKSELQGVQENMNGNFKGIGIQFRMIRDSVTVLNIIKGGPSEKAGILAGDRILIADNDTIFGKKYKSDQIMDRLKGKDTNEVALTVYRKQNDSLLNFNFNRGKVNIASVLVYYMVNSSIGFIKIDRFAHNTYDEFHTALLELKSNGMQTLILDLRGNTGGFMDIANEIVDEFLVNDKLIVFTKNKAGKITNSTATSKGDFETGTIYVLIDEDSASASEIVAGALQDNDKGIIVGRRSFGKGLVQQEMELGDGSAIRLTTARYYTPTGRSIQKPYDHNNTTAYKLDKFNRMNNGELLNKDSIHVNDSLKFTTAKGKIVYGGGGIIPDVFVPIDTTLYLPGFQLGKINNFIFDYIDNNRSHYSKMTWEDFNTNFDEQHVMNAYLKEVQQGYHQKTIKSKFLQTYLKALIARELFNETGFYRIYENHDNMIQKVLELEKKQIIEVQK
jgi:carboxyl-terminal processing protease